MQADKVGIGITAVLGAAAVAVAFYVRAELSTHSVSELAHPLMVAQLGDIKGAQTSILADLKKAEVMRVDALICEDPANNFYPGHIVELLAEWELLTGQLFPRELLRCAT